MIKIKEALEQISPSKCIHKYKREYSKKINESHLEYLINKGQKIANYINGNKHNVSLLVGEVQSGKTATISSVIANHFDNGSNFVVFTPSTDTILLDQTTRRMKEDHETSNVKVLLINDIDFNDSTKLEKFLENKVILLLLKNEKRMKDVIKLIRHINKKLINPLFIDDEGDQASFDDVSSEEKTTIHRCVVDLHNSHRDMHLLTVTATPMAHILVNEEYLIKPDKAFYTKPGNYYFGLEKFIDDENGIIEIIEKDIDKNYFGGNSIIPDSLRVAIRSFMFSSAFLHLLNEDIQVTSMLIHVDNLVNHNKKVSEMVETIIKSISDKYKENPNFFDDELKIFLERHKNLISNEYKWEFNFNEFKELVMAHLNHTSSILVVGENKKESIDSLHSPDHKNYIFIGSQMLQRGVTIPNLIHTYFTYRGEGISNADTILQRARWFGYKKNEKIDFLDFVKVFMTQESKDDFINLNDMSIDMINKIKILEDMDLPFPQEYDRMVYLPRASLRAVRESLIKNYRTSLSKFITDTSNKTSIIAEKLFYSNLLNPNLDSNVMPGQPYKGVHFDSFKDFKDFTPEWESIYNELNIIDIDAKTLSDYLEKKDPDVYVVNMFKKDSDTQVRSISGEGLISVSRGHSGKGDGKGSSYVGDRYWSRHPSGKFKNSIIIHLYKFRIINDSYEDNTIYKIAISLPEEYYGEYIHGLD